LTISESAKPRVPDRVTPAGITSEYVTWLNDRRLHGEIGDREAGRDGTDERRADRLAREFGQTASVTAAGEIVEGWALGNRG
jgi:hypothetical protein